MSLRLFVALDLPRDARRALAQWADRVAPATVRRVPEGNLHVTLAFLGARSQDAADAVAALLPSLARPIGPLSTTAAVWLPPRRPSVLAVALAGSTACSALHADVVAGLVAAVDFKPERRAFAPHVTVGRVRRGDAAARPALVAPPELTFDAEALTLYRSSTGPGGARYEALARAATLA